MNPLQKIIENAIKNHQSRNYDEALKLYQLALKENPNNLDLNILYAQIHFDIGKVDESLKLFSSLIAVNTNSHILFYNRSTIYRKIKLYENSLDDINRCLAINHNSDEALNSKGLILSKLKRYQEALNFFNKAIDLDKTKTHFILNKANTLGRLKKFDKALEEFNRLISLNPKLTKAYYGRGLAKEELLNFKGALEDYERSYSIDPSFKLALSAKSRLLIRLGDFERGWELYENRYCEEGIVQFKNIFNKPKWLGKENLNSKTLLLHSEQGLGDTIQFCRYVNLFDCSKIKIILQVQKPLVDLIKTINDQITVIEEGLESPPYDYHCSLMSLPLAFKTNLNNIPQSIPYLKSNREKLIYWKKILGHKSKLRIGIAWSGNPHQINNDRRSFLLSEIQDSLSDDFEWVSLHNSYHSNELKLLDKLGIKNLQNSSHDFSDTAAICDLIDIVISVDTSLAHLSASLGKKVYLMLPYFPDFRWMTDDKKTPWYDNIEIFKHSKNSTWKELIGDIQNKIRLINQTDQLN